MVQVVSLCLFLEELEWRRMDCFGGLVLLWMQLLLSFGLAVIPSSMFSNFWKNKILSNFLFLDLSSFSILYSAARIKQMYGGLNPNRKFLSLSSDVVAPWTSNYDAVNYEHPMFSLCSDLKTGLITTTYTHFEYKLKPRSLWRTLFCCVCRRRKVQRVDVKYNYLMQTAQEKEGDAEGMLDGESLEMNTPRLQFTEYYPTKFAEIRAWNGIDSESYIKSFERPLLAFIANSKLSKVCFFLFFFVFIRSRIARRSGMYFFYCSNGKFLVKSLKKSEFNFLHQILNEYYEFLRDHQNTLINRFYGMYGVKHKKETIYFVVMESIFYSNLDVDCIYDLKGSTKGRISASTETVKKDLNWKQSQREIKIGAKAASLYRDQLRADTAFLERMGIMDYSLLLGIHSIDEHNKRNSVLYRLGDSFHLDAASPFLFTFCHRGMLSDDKTEIYFGGIIDILQRYNAKKKVENAVRRIKNNQKEISCAPPDVYANRMCEFLCQYIV